MLAAAFIGYYALLVYSDLTRPSRPARFSRFKDLQLSFERSFLGYRRHAQGLSLAIVCWPPTAVR